MFLCLFVTQSVCDNLGDDCANLKNLKNTKNGTVWLQLNSVSSMKVGATKWNDIYVTESVSFKILLPVIQIKVTVLFSDFLLL